jgi:aminoglycoside phosphotransferase (APT) family kinase protein
LERLAAAHVPGTGAVGLELLSSGFGSLTYRARREGQLYALKISTDRSVRLPQRRFELLVLESAAAAGLAPRPLASDADQRVLVLEWLAGTCMSEASAKQPDAALASLLRGVHALPLPALRRVMRPRAWIDHYGQALKLCGLGLGRELSARAAAFLERLEAEPPAELCVCHSDLHRLNVLVREAGPNRGALALLDWEYSHLSEPFWDLAGWSANNDLEPEARAALLAAYQGRIATSAERERLAVLVWLYDYVCLQWIRLYVTRQPAGGATFAARAALLESRLRSPVYGTIAVPTDF